MNCADLVERQRREVGGGGEHWTASAEVGFLTALDASRDACRTLENNKDVIRSKRDRTRESARSAKGMSSQQLIPLRASSHNVCACSRVGDYSPIVYYTFRYYINSALI